MSAFGVMIGSGIMVTWVRGGPGALERAQEASNAVAEALLAMVPDSSGAIHAVVNHDEGCPAMTHRNIKRCTCLLVEVIITALSKSGREDLEATGDYTHVRDSTDEKPGLAQRSRWPAEA